VKMPEVEASERIKSNVEVNKGISAEMAMQETGAVSIVLIPDA